MLQVGSVLAGERLGKLGRVDAAGVAGHGRFSSMVEGLHALPLRHAPTPYGIAADGGVVAPRSGFVQPFAQAGGF
jgi:hypothetical protein